VASGIGGTMKPEKSDGSDLRWKRSETKANEPRGERRFQQEESKQRED
jgi:hypothetical protein